jgi:hypothetical protein
MNEDLRPKQRARYVSLESLEDPRSVEAYVDELLQSMGEEHLWLRSLLPVKRSGDTVGFWVFFSRAGEADPEA